MYEKTNHELLKEAVDFQDDAYSTMFASGSMGNRARFWYQYYLELKSFFTEELAREILAAEIKAGNMVPAVTMSR